MNVSKHNLTAMQKELVHREIKRQMHEVIEDYYVNSISIYLYSLWMYAGWGKRKLLKYYKVFDEMHKELLEYYKLPKSDDGWLCRQKLKNDLDIDIEKWIQEDYT